MFLTEINTSFLNSRLEIAIFFFFLLLKGEGELSIGSSLSTFPFKNITEPNTENFFNKKKHFNEVIQ